MKYLFRLVNVFLICSAFIAACSIRNDTDQASLIASQKQTVNSPVPTLATTAINNSPEDLVYSTNNTTAELVNPSTIFHIASNSIREVIWSPTDEYLAVQCNQGIWLYQTGDLDHPPRLLSLNTSMTPLVFSVDGKLIAAIGADGVIKIWNTPTGELVAMFDGPDNLAYRLAIRPDNRTLALLADNRIYLWDIQSGARQESLPLPDKRIFDLAFSKDGTLQVAGNSDDTYVTETIAEPSWTFVMPGGDASSAGPILSPPTTRRVLKPTARTVNVWNAHTRDIINTLDGLSGAIITARFEGPDYLMMTLEPLPEQQMEERPHILWNMTTDEHTNLNDLEQWSGTALKALNPEHRLWATLEAAPNDNAIITIHHFDLRQLRRIEDTMLLAVNQPEQPQTGVEPVFLPVEMAFSSNGDYLAAWNVYGIVSLYNVALAEQFATLDDFRPPVTSLAIGPDNKSLTVGDDTGRISVFDLASGTQLNILRAYRGSIVELAYDPKGDLLISLDNQQNSWLWDTISPTEEKIEIPGVQIGLEMAVDVRSLRWAFSDQSSGVIRLWTFEDKGYGKHIFASHDIFSLKFSPDGQWLASGGTTGTITLWDSFTQDAVLTLNSHRGVVTGLLFSEDGTRLISWSSNPYSLDNLTPDNTLRVWDLATGKNIYALDISAAQPSAIDVSADGTLLALASHDEPVVKVWDLSTNTILAELEADSRVTSLKFTSDALFLISGSTKGTVSVWPLDS